MDHRRQTIEKPSESIAFSQGKMIDGYKIESHLTSGSQCELFKSRNNIINVYFINNEPDDHLVECLTNVENTHLLRIYKHGVYQEHKYIVTKKYSKIVDFLSMTVEEQIEMIHNQVEAIKELHNFGYCHLDIKKEHFMFDGNNVVLIDIGCASKIGETYTGPISPFASAELYSGVFTKETDYFAFGIAILEQYNSDLFKDKSRQEIIDFVHSGELISECNQLPKEIREEVKSLLSDNPENRNNCSWFSNITNVSNNELSTVKEAVVVEILELAHKANAEIFSSTIPNIIKNKSLTDKYELLAILQMLKSLPRNDSDVNYTNLNKENVLIAINEGINTSLVKKKNNPYKAIKHMAKRNIPYVLNKAIVDELDKNGSEINALKEEKAWSALKIIGIVLGVMLAIAVAILLIFAIIYIVAFIICVAIIVAIIVVIIAGLCAAAGG